MVSAKKMSPSNNLAKVKNSMKTIGALYLVSSLLVVSFVMYFIYMVVSNLFSIQKVLNHVLMVKWKTNVYMTTQQTLKSEAI